MLETVTAMASRGWAVHVTMPTPGPLVAEVEKRGGVVAFTPTPVLRKSALTPKGFLRLIGQTFRALLPSIRLIKASDARLVYVSTLTIPLWTMLPRLLGRPVVCHVHESERSAPLLVRRVLALPLLMANRVIVNSQFSRSVLLDSYRRLADRSEVIYNAVAGPAIVDAPRLVLDRPLRMLFIGRLSPRKGPQVAIELVALLRDRGNQVRLDIVGAVFEGYEWFEEQLRARIGELGIADLIVFHGFQPHVWESVSDCDLVLVPSQGDEPFGNTAVEAVLAARPVVVSSSSGLTEAVAGYHCAQQVPAGELTAWADAVCSVSDGWPAYRAGAIADSQIAAERHSPERYQELIERRLSDCASRSAGQAAIV
jgi:glycosyltransferase involved in cell wall biosynthesis